LRGSFLRFLALFLFPAAGLDPSLGARAGSGRLRRLGSSLGGEKKESRTDDDGLRGDFDRL